MGRLGNKENISNASSNSVSSIPFARGTRVRHSLPEPSLNQRHTNRDRRFRPSWRTWNSVPEETTDTENEDVESKKLLDYCPPPHSFRDRTYSEASEEAFDNSGEYVTFFHAHAYATRDMHNVIPDYSNSYSQEKAMSDIEKSYESSYESEIKNSVCDKAEHQKDQDSESGSSASSWKQNSAIRRVQSFTGMAKARVQSLQYNMSFKYSSHSEAKGKSKKTSNLPPSGSSFLPSVSKETSPIAPAAWLKQQEEHLADGGKKSGSLPRSFQLAADSSSNSNEMSGTSGENTCRMRMRVDGSRSVHGDRPFTIASDKPSHADFGDDLDYVVLDYSQYTGTEYYFQPQNNNYEHDTTTGCTNTPAVSMENVHTIHPELKIYHQAASKYATLKHLFSHMGSKIAGLKANIVSPTSEVPVSSELTKSQNIDATNKNNFKRSGSHSSIKSENELSPKIFTAKLAHSVAKAYSHVMRHKKKHEIKITDVTSSKKNEKVSLGTYKSESSLIGARMAQPLESEYSVPKYILSSKLLKDLRPDSLFSESSNVTSSSDGDKIGNPESCFHESQFSKSDDNDDSISEASDTSADSYYERTFDEIENALAQDVFRDSAIYSDPEDADFSTVEKPRLLIIPKESEQTKVEDNSYTYQNGDATSPSSPKIMCARKVNQAILDRLRILEENVKYQNEEASSIVNNSASSKPYIQKRLDLDKWGNLVLNKDIEESETSSEHSASTVNTVMESGNKMNGNINSKSPPRVKGWVKHVVDKLQGEGQV